MTYEVGKGKPPKNRQFGQPEGNPTGKTAGQRAAEIKAAEAAARIQARMLEATEGMFNEHPEKEGIVEYIKADMLRLIKDAMDRGYGTPVQSVTVNATVEAEPFSGFALGDLKPDDE